MVECRTHATGGRPSISVKSARRRHVRSLRIHRSNSSSCRIFVCTLRASTAIAVDIAADGDDEIDASAAAAAGVCGTGGGGGGGPVKGDGQLALVTSVSHLPLSPLLRG